MESLKFLSEMFEILDEKLAHTEVSDRRYGGQFNNARVAHQTRDELGRGAFSKVRPDQNDPHMVQKQSVVPLGKAHQDKEDGFAGFVRMMLENDLMDNIHFPKIYKAQKTTDTTGTHRNSYTMEKLEPLTSLSREEAAALEERHMNPGYDEDFALYERIYDACRSSRAREMYIKMDSLKEACETLDELDDISDFRLDINRGNLMVRRTPHGLQLVISDPFGMIKSQWLHKYQ